MLVSVIQCDITPHDTTNTALVLFIRLCKCSHKQCPNMHATLVSIFTQNYVQIRNLTLQLNFVPTLAFPSWHVYIFWSVLESKRLKLEHWTLSNGHTIIMYLWVLAVFLKLHFHSHRWWSSAKIYNNFW